MFYNQILNSIKSFSVCLLFLNPVISLAQSHYPGQHKGMFAIEDKLKVAVYSFDLQDVKLLDSRFKQNMQREQKWLMSIGANGPGGTAEMLEMNVSTLNSRMKKLGIEKEWLKKGNNSE